MRLRACLAAVGLAVLALVVLWKALPAQAADGVVGSGTPESCTSPELAAEAAAGGFITFNCGPDPYTIVVTTTISPGPNTTLDGGSAGQITLDGNVAVRLFYIAPGRQVTITRLVLINGRANAPGGAIANQGGRLVLDEVRLENNRVPSPWGGGAIYNYSGGELIAHSSEFVDNQSIGGGAINNDPSSRVTLLDSLLSGNRAYGIYGGAITNNGLLTVTGGLFTGNLVTYTLEVGYAIGGGGIANLAGGKAWVNGTTFSDNVAGPGYPGNHSGGAMLNAGTAHLTGVQVVGNLAYRGGGLHNTGTLLLTDTVVAYNSAVVGGGLFHEAGALTVSGGQVAGNTATSHGGGLYNGWNVEVVPATFDGTLFSDNEALQNGGGIYVYKGSVDLVDSVLEDNQAGENGGGVYVYFSVLRSSGSTLRRNEAAASGGGIWNVGERLALTNTTLSGNAAGQAGGGLYTTSDSGASLRHVTLAENRAVQGGAIAWQGAHTPVLTNTIVANSPQGGNCFGGAVAAKYSLDSDSTCDLTGAGNKTGDPRLTALGDYGGPTQVHMLQPDSPALNGVMGSDAASVDQRGQPRPVGAYDIGAVERQTDDSSLAPRMRLPLVLR